VKFLSAFVLLLFIYATLIGPLSQHMEQRQTLVKLGYVPNGKMVKILAGDQKTSIGALYTLKSIIYYGGMIQQWHAGNRQTPEMSNLFSFLESSVQLDPYNMDSYYFAQAAFTWEVGHAADVNKLLAYGMRFRDWDWLLPYYAGFNSAYFLHDYPAGATYMRKAAMLSGNNLLAQLTARYLQGSGQTAFAVAFLDDMIARSRDKKLVQQLVVRKQALAAILKIESALGQYIKRYNKNPLDINDLVLSGLLLDIPEDPYGGVFYLDADGSVKSTSNLTFARENEEK